MKLKVIELLNPYDNWNNTLVQEYYTKLISLKLEGYKKTYKNIIPVDAYDLISDHYMICIDKKGSLEPICAIKHIKKVTTQRFKLKLPCYEMLKSLNDIHTAQKQFECLNNFINETDRKNIDTFYTCSVTIKPEYRGHSELNKKISTIISSTIPWYKEVNNIHTSTIIAVKKVKTDILLQNMGFEKASYNGTSLGSFPNPLFNNEDVLLLFLKELSFLGQRNYNECRKYFEQMEVIGNRDIKKSA